MLNFEKDAILMVDSHHGIYVPQVFAQQINRSCVHTDSMPGGDNALEMALDYLANGPNQEEYWETWTDVLDHCLITCLEEGRTFYLWQDQDVWLVPEGCEVPEF